MSVITIFHGSNHIITKPEYFVGKPYNDYGKGFYCTNEIEMAKEWACKENTNGFVNEYQLNISDLKILDLQDSKYNVLNWIALLLKNRKFELSDPVSITARKYILDNYLIDTSDYDIIIGYRADDSYFSYAQSFVANSLSVRLLEEALKLGELGIQVALVSEKAFENIKYINAFSVEKEIYYSKYINRDLSARKYFFENIKNKQFSLDDVFIVDIMRKKLKNND